MVDVFRKGKFELLALNEIKMKGNGEAKWYVINSITMGVQEIKRAREDVAIFMNDVWHSAVIDFECVSSRTIWVH